MRRRRRRTDVERVTFTAPLCCVILYFSFKLFLFCVLGKNWAQVPLLKLSLSDRHRMTETSCTWTELVKVVELEITSCCFDGKQLTKTFFPCCSSSQVSERFADRILIIMIMKRILFWIVSSFIHWMNGQHYSLCIVLISRVGGERYGSLLTTEMCSDRWCDIHSASSLSNGVEIWDSVQDEHLDLAAFLF